VYIALRMDFVFAAHHLTYADAGIALRRGFDLVVDIP